MEGYKDTRGTDSRKHLHEARAKAKFHQAKAIASKEVSRPLAIVRYNKRKEVYQMAVLHDVDETTSESEKFNKTVQGCLDR